MSADQCLNHLKLSIKKKRHRDFPGGPVVETLLSNAGDAGLIPGWGAGTPHAWGPKKPKRRTEVML